MTVVAQVQVGELPVVLALTQHWEDRGVHPRAAKQVDPVTTTLTPTTKPEPGVQSWLLTGYRLHRHDEPGDTLVTYQLLCEVHPDGRLEGFWYEDHMEVPRSLWAVTGRIDGRTIVLAMDGREVRGEIWRGGSARGPAR